MIRNCLQFLHTSDNNSINALETEGMSQAGLIELLMLSQLINNYKI